MVVVKGVPNKGELTQHIIMPDLTIQYYHIIYGKSTIIYSTHFMLYFT